MAHITKDELKKEIRGNHTILISNKLKLNRTI